MKNGRLELSDINWEVICRPSDIPIKGYCSAIDAETDKETEEWIERELASGNEWAWCDVEVRGEFRGLIASDHLGGCSYKSREAFCQPNDYYGDMQQTVLDDLNDQLSELLSAVENS